VHYSSIASCETNSLYAEAKQLSRGENVKKIIVLFLTLGMLAALQVHAVAAGVEFHVQYQQVDVVKSPGKVSGLVILNVMNTSGGDVKDLSASLAGPNSILYETRSVLLGDIPDDGEVQIGVPFATPINAGSPEKESTWVITYTDASGASHEINVIGVLVQ